MMTKWFLLGLIALTSLTFSLSYLALEQHMIAAVASVAGLIWLRLETSHTSYFPAAFFLLFFGLATLGSLSGLSALVMLLGLCAGLAAWDLSRFRARATYAGSREIEPVLEARHLQRLAVTIGAGMLLGLVPAMISLPVNFVTFAVLVVALLLLLRASVLYLRQG